MYNRLYFNKGYIYLMHKNNLINFFQIIKKIDNNLKIKYFNRFII